MSYNGNRATNALPSHSYFIVGTQRLFLEIHRDKVVVIKYYSVSCKACKALEPKFKKLASDSHRSFAHSDLPVVFAQIPMTRNSDFFQHVLHLQALPSVQIYSADVLLDSFPCPPKMFSSLKQKVDHWVKLVVDPEGRTLSDAWSPDPTPVARPTNEFFAHEDDDIPLQISDLFMTDDDDADDDYPRSVHLPRNNIIPAPRASEFLACKTK